MTLEEMIQETWEGLTEVTDLDPYDDTGAIDVSTHGGKRIRDALNIGQRTIAHWKDPQTGQRIRFHSLFGDGYFQGTIRSGEALPVTADTKKYIDLKPIDDDTGVASTDTVYEDQYNGWILAIDGEYYHIAKSLPVPGNSAHLRVFPAKELNQLANEYQGDDYVLYKNFFYLLSDSSHNWASEHIVLPSGDRALGQGNLLELTKIYDMTNERELTQSPRGERFVLSSAEVGQPFMFWKHGGRIYFDKAPGEEDWYRYEYYRDPAGMEALGDEPELPEMFHWGIVLWAIEWGYRRAGESNEKYSVKRDFVDFMRSTKTQWDVRFEDTQAGGTADFRR